MLTITAIVPTCDRPPLLERALRSIVAQEFLPTEIIVVDDAGEGHENVTRRALESCCLTGVRVVANANAKGASGARNTGADLATSELLAFLDDDDEWLPSYLAQAVSRCNWSELDMVCTDLLCQFDDGVDESLKVPLIGWRRSSSWREIPVSLALILSYAGLCTEKSAGSMNHCPAAMIWISASD
jgi:glycosyltransferase involved in cell wall biosynthesis